MFPDERPRRLRRTPALRRLVRESDLRPSDLILPLFVAEGLREPREISSLPGHVQHTVDSLCKEVEAAATAGVGGVILFGVPRSKDATGSGASDPEGVAQVALRALRDRFADDVVLIADLCLDEYTSHGHCGVLGADGTVDNDATLVRYGEVAIAQATAGAQIVAPSGMMDGQVAAIRRALDGAGFQDTAILAYAAKFASTLYGPFREAVAVEIAHGGDRRGYQLDPANRREAAREAALDEAEGADLLMVKPAGGYLDVLSDLRRATTLPLAAYQVSGEYAMVRAAAERGWIDGPATALEQLLGIKRAGADVILTYFAREVAEALGR